MNKDSNLVEKVIQAHSNNYTKGRSGRKIEAITIHHVAGVITIENLGKIWQNSERNGSSHYGIGNDGKIAQYVPERDTAWCNSNWDSNCKSVTIEVSNNKVGGDWTVSDAALNSLIKLVADISKRNSITLKKGTTVTWHSMFKNTACPGPYLLSKIDYIINEANKINNPIVKKSVLEIAREVIAGKWGNGQDRKTRLANTGYDYSTVQAKVNELLKVNTVKIPRQAHLTKKTYLYKESACINVYPSPSVKERYCDIKEVKDKSYLIECSVFNPKCVWVRKADVETIY